MRWHCYKLLDVFIEVLSSSVRNGIGDICHRSWHKWNGPRSPFAASLDLKFLQQGNLKVIEVLVISRKFPMSPILEFDVDDVPILVIVKAPPRYRG